VIAIIVILASLLFPALNRAKSAAELSMCRSNVRQIMLAMNQYVQETAFYPYFTNLIPALYPFTRALWPPNNWDFSHPGPGVFLGAQNGIYACPGYNRLQGQCFSDPTRMYPICGSYGYNRTGGLAVVLGGGGLGIWGRGADFAYETSLGTPEKLLVAPSDMIGMGDAIIEPVEAPGISGSLFLEGAEIFNDRLNFNALIYGKPTDNAAVLAMNKRHNGRWNIGFCDSHVETLRVPQLFNFSNSVVAQRWNRDHQAHNDGWTPP